MQEGLARSRYHVNAKIAIYITKYGAKIAIRMQNMAQKLQFDLL